MHLSRLSFFLYLYFLVRIYGNTDVTITDKFVPEDCDTTVNPGDHVMVAYDLFNADGTAAYSWPQYSAHLHVVSTDNNKSLMQRVIVGMCKNATRLIEWNTEIEAIEEIVQVTAGVRSIAVTVNHITEPADYDIFVKLVEGNSSAIFDMLSTSHGALAVDSYGHSPLMIAVANELMSSFSYLMNTRLPRIDINYAKPNGYTALMYAVKAKSVSMLKALLLRGADPTMTLKTTENFGYTPLHFACLWERVSHVELLLQYGADPEARSENGDQPYDLVPNDAGRALRKQLKKLMVDAYNAKHSQESGAGGEGSKERKQSHIRDL